MRRKIRARQVINVAISAVWLINGLVCKVMNLVPRHEQIVARIIGSPHAGVVTRAIGFAEIAMAVWIVSGIRKRLNAIVQVVVIATMNGLEFVMAPDLLLWGRLNAVFALLFIVVILFNEFYFRNRPAESI